MYCSVVYDKGMITMNVEDATVAGSDSLRLTIEFSITVGTE